MNSFLEQWGNAAHTSLGYFWMALWAFVLGYLISSMIQVFVTTRRMTNFLGGEGFREISLATFFGFISSSCSFAALATTKSLFRKGAGFIPSLAFLLASTNLVIELGIVISIFLSWQFVVGEYLGGLLLILFMWIFVRLTRPEKLVRQVRERLSGESHSSSSSDTDWKEKLLDEKKWYQVGMRYKMEWDMVWQDVTIGFTLAGVIAEFVPSSFFSQLFIGDPERGYSFWELLMHTLAGPVAAFFTFIGSMGNIPLAGVLYENGVSFAGIMAFIFSDLVVLPVLRINARYYGWRMSFYILLTLLTALVLTTLGLYYFFDLISILPDQTVVNEVSREFFKLDYTFYLNIIFLVISGILIWLSTKNTSHMHHRMADRGKTERILTYLARLCYIWLALGMLFYFL